VRKLLQLIPALVAELSRHTVELLELVGIALIVYGAHQVYGPAAPITAGALLLAIAWNATRTPPGEDDE
jgi:hypothetical protein